MKEKTIVAIKFKAKRSKYFIKWTAHGWGFAHTLVGASLYVKDSILFNNVLVEFKEKGVEFSIVEIGEINNSGEQS